MLFLIYSATDIQKSPSDYFGSKSVLEAVKKLGDLGGILSEQQKETWDAQYKKMLAEEFNPMLWEEIFQKTGFKTSKKIEWDMLNIVYWNRRCEDGGKPHRADIINGEKDGDVSYPIRDADTHEKTGEEGIAVEWSVKQGPKIEREAGVPFDYVMYLPKEHKDIKAFVFDVYGGGYCQFYYPNHSGVPSFQIERLLAQNGIAIVSVCLSDAEKLFTVTHDDEKRDKKIPLQDGQGLKQQAYYHAVDHNNLLADIACFKSEITKYLKAFPTDTRGNTIDLSEKPQFLDGFSFGAGLTMFYATSDHPQFNGYIAGAGVYLKYKMTNHVKWDELIKKLQNPVLLLQGRDDETVLPKNMLFLYEEAKKAGVEKKIRVFTYPGEHTGYRNADYAAWAIFDFIMHKQGIITPLQTAINNMRLATTRLEEQKLICSQAVTPWVYIGCAISDPFLYFLNPLLSAYDDEKKHEKCPEAFAQDFIKDFIPKMEQHHDAFVKSKIEELFNVDTLTEQEFKCLKVLQLKMELAHIFQIPITCSEHHNSNWLETSVQKKIVSNCYKDQELERHRDKLKEILETYRKPDLDCRAKTYRTQMEDILFSAYLREKLGEKYAMRYSDFEQIKTPTFQERLIARFKTLLAARKTAVRDVFRKAFEQEHTEWLSHKKKERLEQRLKSLFFNYLSLLNHL